MATTDPRLTALKIAYKGELHRVRVDLSAFQYEDLARLFAETFSLSPASFLVQYTDAEGDVVNVTSQAEYIEACRVFLASPEATKSLRFSAVSRTQVVFQENVADPILKAIEKLVETLTAALNKVKQEEWAHRAQQGVEQTTEVLNRAAQRAQVGFEQAAQYTHVGLEQAAQYTHAGLEQAAQYTHSGLEQAAQRAQDGMDATGEVLNRAAQRAQVGVEQTGEVLNRAAKDARESLCAARQSIQEIPFDQILRETGDSLKAAAETIHSFAHEVVDEIKKLQVTPPTQAPPADPEWERVEEQPAAVAEAVPAPVVEETPAPVVEPEIVEVVAPSAEEIKWAAELSKVRDIFPDVDAQRVIDNLEQCNGNVHVVLNSLMEDM